MRRLGVRVALLSLALGACQYDVPITSSPTRKVQEQLLADWRSTDGKEELKLRGLDDSTYIVYYDGDLFALTTPTSRKHLSRPFRTSTRAIANMLTWFGSSQMMASI